MVTILKAFSAVLLTSRQYSLCCRFHRQQLRYFRNGRRCVDDAWRTWRTWSRRCCSCCRYWASSSLHPGLSRATCAAQLLQRAAVIRLQLPARAQPAQGLTASKPNTRFKVRLIYFYIYRFTFYFILLTVFYLFILVYSFYVLVYVDLLLQ